MLLAVILCALSCASALVTLGSSSTRLALRSTSSLPPSPSSYTLSLPHSPSLCSGHCRERQISLLAVSQRQEGGDSDLNSLWSDFKSSVCDNKIFLWHAVTAVAFGTALLFLPGMFSLGNAIAGFQMQIMSVFVLACGTFAFAAPTLDKKSQLLLADTFKYSFSLATIICVSEILKSLGKPYYGLGYFLLDLIGAAVFGLTAAGYWVNGKGDGRSGLL